MMMEDLVRICKKKKINIDIPGIEFNPLLQDPTDEIKNILPNLVQKKCEQANVFFHFKRN